MADGATTAATAHVMVATDPGLVRVESPPLSPGYHLRVVGQPGAPLLLTHRLDTDLITACSDNLTRVAESVKYGHRSSSVAGGQWITMGWFPHRDMVERDAGDHSAKVARAASPWPAGR